MHWWAWALIWTGLVLAMIGMFVLLAWRLARKGLAVLNELGNLGDKIDRLQDNVETLTPEKPENAILLGYAAVATRRDAENSRRTRAKELRRERRIQRGKLLVRSSPSKENWNHGR